MFFKPLILSLAFSAILFTGFSAPSAQLSAEDRAYIDKAVAVDDFVETALPFLRYNGIAFEVLYKLGKVRKEESEIVRNDHWVDGKAEYKTVAFENGLEIEGYVGSRLHPLYIRVTDSHWEIQYNLSVGATTTAIIKQLGEPDKKSKNKFFYNGMIHSVDFLIEQDIVSSVILQYND